MRFVEQRLDPSQASLVEAVFYVGEYDPPEPIERLVPDGSCNLVIELDGHPRSVVDNETHEPVQPCIGSWFSGLHASYVSFTTPPRTELLGVRFRPGGAAPFVVQALDDLAGRVVPARDAFGEDVDALRRDLLGVAAPDDKLRRLVDWLDARRRESDRPPASLMRAIASITGEPTVGTLDGLHDKVGVSAKQLVAQFRRYVGVTPKLFQRIMRFAAVVGSVHARESIDWARLSAECGFSDQAHLIREFSKFSGFRPGDFVRRDDERVNFFPEARKPGPSG